MKRILVLYRELAGYFVTCLNELCEQHDLMADVVAYPVHQDAPFDFVFSPRIQCFDRNAMTSQTLHEMAASGSYSMIFCGGWGDKLYLSVVAKNRQIPSLLGFDNQWNGSVRQRLACLYARFKISPLFDMAFVPGPEQVLFARKMGFHKIVQGAYSCDVDRFSSIERNRSNDFWTMERKTLFFVGRYADAKFITELQDVFIELNDSVGMHWKLVCAGTGPLWESRRVHPSVEHLGFMQPEVLWRAMEQAHGFVLPSTFEPWGVVVHEFATAGVPLVLSTAVGARTAFIENGQNGFVFQSGQRDALKSALTSLMSSEPEQLQRMSEHSAYLAHKITPQTWSHSLIQLLTS
jgi:glycosyltransferase involved in cell wall biosynthesis